MLKDEKSKEAKKYLKDLLEKFDYKEQDILPAELLEAVNNGDLIVCGKERGDGTGSGYLALAPERIFLLKEVLRAHLCNEKGYKDSDEILGLLIEGLEESSGYIYYDPKTGKRLGDGLGIYTWVLKD